MAIDGGPLMTPAQTLALAETRFTDAIQLANTAGNTSIVNFATLGRARVRLDQGRDVPNATNHCGRWVSVVLPRDLSGRGR